MPLVYQQHINEHTKIGVWEIREPEDFFLQKVMLHNAITHAHKRLQHLAGRYLLKELFLDFPLELIKIAGTRKPFLANEAYHFSISHCGNFAAAIASTANRVGVDIEVPQQKIEAIKNKFLTETEQRIVSAVRLNELQVLTIAWSIKEAMFKWYGIGQVNFRQHMIIDTLQEKDFAFTAACRFVKDDPMYLQLHAIMFNGISLAYLVT